MHSNRPMPEPLRLAPRDRVARAERSQEARARRASGLLRSRANLRLAAMPRARRARRRPARRPWRNNVRVGRRDRRISVSPTQDSRSATESAPHEKDSGCAEIAGVRRLATLPRDLELPNAFTGALSSTFGAD